MNSMDRVLATLDHEEPDRVPLTDHPYLPKSLEGILARPGVRVDTPGEYVEAHKIVDIDLISAFPASFPLIQLEKGVYIDDWKIRWKVVDDMPWYLDGALKTPKDLD
nr:hypothetical protein [Candidatus Njordarchaeum guaymaensis]